MKQTTSRMGRRKVLAAAVGSLLAAGRARADTRRSDAGAKGAPRDPRLTDEERTALLLEMHKRIEVAADQAMRRLTRREPVGPLIYPAGLRLTPAETEALGRLAATPESIQAVRAIVAAAVAGPVYDLLCMIDGAREPEGWELPWRPFEVRGTDDGSRVGTLHTDFRKTYEEWQRRRPDPGWRLEGGRDKGKAAK